MSRSSHIFGCVVFISLVTSIANGQVGEPSGFTITVKHGASTLATDNVTIGPGQELQDTKATFQDGDPEDFTQIGTVGAGNPMILKVVSEDDPMYRVLHLYINVPISLANINAPGPTSLFNPADSSLISVEITNATFFGGMAVEPRVENDNAYYVSFMRDFGGHFYELPQANAYNTYGSGIYDIQVPGNKYLDGTPGTYNFTSTQGAVSSWTWGNMLNPGAGTTIHNGFAGGLASTGSGYVFELGLSVAFINGVPEPATMMFVAGGAMVLLGSGRQHVHKRRKARNG